jgi:hypothetical protein
LKQVYQGSLYLSDHDAETLFKDWMAPEVQSTEVPAAVENLRQVRAVFTSHPGQAWWVVSPLAARTPTSIAGDIAQVPVWTLTVMASAGGLPPVASYLTITFGLAWRDGRWMVASTDSQPGPVAMLDDSEQPATASVFARRVDGFALVEEAR